ncbi:hypothetical protein L1N85_19885 [Paenibacillus alkaliterrae]|uniref:hypothetical protein n=1 Tax=Paenibacillus alkaliterrae TaxID=320909 RepID=UPI001F178268|nr:hypothetical protein [Paenibacillus alkaliterrae]MCF2940656.1 hypothetical protein [Paenibacillus alkaliterrae]
MKEESIYFHGGIYRFSFPYLGAYLGRNEENEVKVDHCDVELRIGGNPSEAVMKCQVPFESHLMALCVIERNPRSLSPKGK